MTAHPGDISGQHSRRAILKGLSLLACSCLAPVSALAASPAMDLAISGQEMLAAGNPARAMRMLAEAARLDPTDPWIQGLLGRAAYLAGEPRQALEAFRQALRLSPDDGYARMMVDVILQNPVPPSPEALGDDPLEQAAREEYRRFMEGSDNGPSQESPDAFRVVLDPGHGGFDPGAAGPGGLEEKDVVLSVAIHAARQLRELGVQVFLTRSGDYYMPLSDRTATANQYHADLFVSVHANAHARTTANGVETYYSSERPSSDEADRVAAFENAVLRFDERDGGPVRINVEDILFRFERMRHWKRSASAAGSMQAALAGELPFRDRGVQSAGFHVLRTARMPAVLLELGFLSNPQEGELLASETFRMELGTAVARAVDAWSGRAHG